MKGVVFTSTINWNDKRLTLRKVRVKPIFNELNMNLFIYAL